jgi:hypothetical protein
MEDFLLCAFSYEIVYFDKLFYDRGFILVNYSMTVDFFNFSKLFYDSYSTDPSKILSWIYLHL